MIHKISILIISFLFVALLGCDDDRDTCTQPSNIPATVFITYPVNNSTVFEIAMVTCMVAENDGIEKVTLWVDGYHISGAEDSSEPYELYWNTTVYENLSSHTIVARALDIYSHITDSEPITLKVDNTDFYPAQVNIQSIVYQDESFIITWRPSRDSDFSHYTLYQSSYRDMSNKTWIYSSTNADDTIYVVDNIADNESRYYQLSVMDTIGLEALSHMFTGSSLDSAAFGYIGLWADHDQEGCHEDWLTGSPEIYVMVAPGESGLTRYDHAIKLSESMNVVRVIPVLGFNTHPCDLISSELPGRTTDISIFTCSCLPFGGSPERPSGYSVIYTIQVLPSFNPSSATVTIIPHSTLGLTAHGCEEGVTYPMYVTQNFTLDDPCRDGRIVATEAQSWSAIESMYR